MLPAEKDKVNSVLKLEYMSSEEERDDCYEVRPLQWRTNECDDVFKVLDKTSWSLMTPKARRQTGKQEFGPFSSRRAPEITQETDWAIRVGY